MSLAMQQQVLQFMQDRQKHLQTAGRLRGLASFPTDYLAGQFSVPAMMMEGLLKDLEKARQIHAISKGQWGLGANPWKGQKRTKILRCPHCKQQFEAEITGD